MKSAEFDFHEHANLMSVDLPPLPSADLETEPAPRLNLKDVSADYLVHLRDELTQQHAAGASGQALVVWYTNQLDRLINYLFAAATQLYARRYARLHQRCTVLAQGGYGRGELNPYSDIDLLFLYHWKITPYVETVCETIYYSLMDAGFVVGHAVRDIRDCVRLANKDFQVKTALLDSRYLCGDESLAQEFATALEREIIGKYAKRFFQEKVQESRARHLRYGGSIYLLEPQLKEGQGGLRDLHTAWWLAKVKFKVQDWHALVQKGVVSARTLAEVEAARNFLWQIRNGLHLLEKAEQDHLTFERQEQLAPTYGFSDVASFMHQYYHHATTLHTFSQAMIERCLETPRYYSFIGRPRGREIREGVRILDGTLVVTKANLFTNDPLNIVTIFHDAQRHGVCIDSPTQHLICDALNYLTSALKQDSHMWTAFVAILTWKHRVAPTLRDMHKLGVLGWLLPEFGRMRWRPQRDLYHVYTVDEHTLQGVTELERLRDGDYKADHPLLTQVMREIDKVELLFLALLYHDVGKGYGHNHDTRSAALVQEAAARWQMSPDDTHEWYLLVQHHLRMSYIAQRRDLSDDTLIADFARTVGTPDVLKKLYLLTFADMKAVGPKVWNSWKGSLIDELYLRTLERFETGESAEEDPEARLQRRKEHFARTLPVQTKASAAQVASFLTSMPDRYFLSTPEEVVPNHFQLISRFLQRAGEDTHDPYLAMLVHFPERECSELTVVTQDRPGLFALLTGVLAAHNLNVVSARISTSQDGIALDVFRLSHEDRRELVMDTDTWARVYTRLSAVLRGERTVENLLQAARPPAFLNKHHPRIPTEVTVDNTSSLHYTVIDITAPDRMGFLFSVTYTLFQLGLVIHLAKITTNVNQVLDMFYVTDGQGAKVVHPDHLAAELQNRIVVPEEQSG